MGMCRVWAARSSWRAIGRRSSGHRDRVLNRRDPLIRQSCPPSAPLRRRRGFHLREDFWIIVAARSEDETEIRGEKQPAEDAIRDIRRATRRHFSAEEKIRVVLEGLRGEEEDRRTLPPSEGIASSMYYGWSKEFLEVGKRQLAGDTARAATSDEVKDLRREAQALKEVVADLTLENRLLKKSMIGDGGDKASRYSASDKTEIIRLVEQSHLPARRTLEKLGIPDRLSTAGMIAISEADRKPSRIDPHGLTGSGTASQRLPTARWSTWRWDQPELSPRELAVRFTDEKKFLVRAGFGSESARSHRQGVRV